MKTDSKAHNRLSEGPAINPRAEGPGGSTVRAVMNGRPASPGITIGRAAVVMGRDDMSRVEEGVIMVSRTATPELVLGMSKAHAIATEHGGPGSLASCFAREYGIPAVVGVAGLTGTVRAGDLLRVDGLKGTVEILETASGQAREEAAAGGLKEGSR